MRASARGYNYVVTTGMESVECGKQQNKKWEKKKKKKVTMKTFETGQNGRHATGCRTFNRKTVSEMKRRAAPMSEALKQQRS